MSDPENSSRSDSASRSENGDRETHSRSYSDSPRPSAPEFIKQTGEISTEISPDLLFKHPLEHTWSFWYYENNKGKSWEENQKEVASFSTVEDFWCLYDHIKLATDVIPGSDYSIFKKGIRPMWEDKMNEKGGRWIIKLENRRSGDLNDMWLDVIMLMIGERFYENEDEICGAILNVRAKCDKISVWTSNIHKKDNVLQIGRKLKECLNYMKDLKLHYESHESVEKKTSKNRYLHSL